MSTSCPAAPHIVAGLCKRESTTISAVVMLLSLLLHCCEVGERRGRGLSHPYHHVLVVALSSSSCCPCCHIVLIIVLSLSLHCPCRILSPLSSSCHCHCHCIVRWGGQGGEERERRGGGPWYCSRCVSLSLSHCHCITIVLIVSPLSSSCRHCPHHIAIVFIALPLSSSRRCHHCCIVRWGEQGGRGEGEGEERVIVVLPSSRHHRHVVR